jgi:cation:H+ antiporter
MPIIIYQLSLIFLSLGILIVSADQLITQADAIARKFNFSQVLIGLTIVAFGTSAPELMVSLSAALFETPPASDAIIGNIIGSNIANLLLVLGVAGLLYNVEFKSIDQKTIFYLLAVTFYFILVLSTVSNIGWLHSIIFFILLVFFINHLAHFSVSTESEIEQEKNISYTKLLLSFVGFFIGGKLFLTESLEFFSRLGLEHTVIGLTVLAIGTSLPELITLIVSAIKKKSAIGIANIIGSNIMNILFVFLPSLAIIQIRGFNFSTINIQPTDLIILSIGTSIIIILSLTKKPLSKVISFVFVLSYLIYIYRLF